MAAILKIHYREVLHYYIIGWFYYIIGKYYIIGSLLHYYIIGAKYYNWYISRYSSSFYGGHFENRFPNPNGPI